MLSLVDKVSIPTKEVTKFSFKNMSHNNTLCIGSLMKNLGISFVLLPNRQHK
jgi:hypothetical protein